MAVMTKPTFTDKHNATDRAFRAIVSTEQAKRAANMARLRAERLAQPAPEPAPAKAKKKKTAPV